MTLQPHNPAFDKLKDICGSSIPSNRQFAEAMGFSEREQKMLEMFWEPTFNGSWIYLSDELIRDHLTNEKDTSGNLKKNAVMHFYDRKLIPIYDKDIDYCEVSANHELVQNYFCSPNLGSRDFKHNKQFFIVSGECFKQLLLSSGTSNGKETRKYYIKVETLASQMKDYITYILLTQKEAEIYQKDVEICQKDAEICQKDTELEKEKARSYRLRKRIKTTLLLTKKEFIYIATSRLDAQEDCFKIGKAANLKARLASYNTGRTSENAFYFCYYFQCYDSASLEKYIFGLLKPFVIQKDTEMVHIRYNLLEDIIDEICKNDDRNVDKINELIRRVETDTSESIIPPPIPLPNQKTTLAICSNTDGGAYEPIQKIDTTDWTTERYNNFMKYVLELFVREDMKIDYRYDTDKDNENIKLGTVYWKSLYPKLMRELGISTYVELKEKIWKSSFKEICKQTKNIDKCLTSRYRCAS